MENDFDGEQLASQFLPRTRVLKGSRLKQKAFEQHIWTDKQILKIKPHFPKDHPYVLYI